MQAQKQAEQQLLAQNKVSKVITPPGTNKLSSAEQDLGSAQPSKKLPGAEQGKGEKKPPAPKPAPAAAASKPSSSAGASPEQVLRPSQPTSSFTLRSIAMSSDTCSDACAGQSDHLLHRQARS